MHRLHRSIVMLILALPAPALAQTSWPANLSGTWVRTWWFDSTGGTLGADFLTLDTNGTYSRESKKKDGNTWVSTGKMVVLDTGKKEVPLHWKVSLDTFFFYSDSFQNTPKEKRGRMASRQRFEIKDQRLIQWSWGMWDLNRRSESCAESVYERFDPAKPLSPPSPEPKTLKPTDLVGTWAGTYKWNNRIDVLDSITFNADSTVSYVHKEGTNKPFPPVKGKWDILPGNAVTGPGIANTAGGTRVMLQDGQMAPCSEGLPVFTRVAP